MSAVRHSEKLPLPGDSIKAIQSKRRPITIKYEPFRSQQDSYQTAHHQEQRRQTGKRRRGWQTPRAGTWASATAHPTQQECHRSSNWPTDSNCQALGPVCSPSCRVNSLPDQHTRVPGECAMSAKVSSAKSFHLSLKGEMDISQFEYSQTVCGWNI